MRTIINGRKYDTETATEIACDKAYPISDGRHYDETLYRKRNGEFFLYGHGGPLSRYSRSVSGSDMWCGGSKVIPLSDEEARSWVESICSYNTYCELFGEPEE